MPQLRMIPDRLSGFMGSVLSVTVWVVGALVVLALLGALSH